MISYHQARQATYPHLDLDAIDSARQGVSHELAAYLRGEDR